MKLGRLNRCVSEAGIFEIGSAKITGFDVAIGKISALQVCVAEINRKERARSEDDALQKYAAEIKRLLIQIGCTEIPLAVLIPLKQFIRALRRLIVCALYHIHHSLLKIALRLLDVDQDGIGFLSVHGQ